MKKLMQRSEGFTLIELMIVILIIAILVAIAVPVYLNSQTNAKRRTCQANMRTIDSAVQSYQANDAGQLYPASIAVMTSTPNQTLKSVPTCPSGTLAYSFPAGPPPFASCPNGHPPSGE